jgi:hypothetical protein
MADACRKWGYLRLRGNNTAGKRFTRKRKDGFEQPHHQVGSPDFQEDGLIIRGKKV